jgi:hypothetical protein
VDKSTQLITLILLISRRLKLQFSNLWVGNYISAFLAKRVRGRKLLPVSYPGLLWLSRQDATPPPPLGIPLSRIMVYYL